MEKTTVSKTKKKKKKPEGVNFAALTDTERAELEAFRQEKKFNLIPILLQN